MPPARPETTAGQPNQQRQSRNPSLSISHPRLYNTLLFYARSTTPLILLTILCTSRRIQLLRGSTIPTNTRPEISLAIPATILSSASILAKSYLNWVWRWRLLSPEWWWRLGYGSFVARHLLVIVSLLWTISSRAEEGQERVRV